MRTVVNNGRPICGSGAEDSSLALRSQRVGEGHPTRCPHGYSLLQTSPDGRASGGMHEGFAPWVPPPGESPWTPGEERRGFCAAYGCLPLRRGRNPSRTVWSPTSVR